MSTLDELAVATLESSPGIDALVLTVDGTATAPRSAAAGSDDDGPLAPDRPFRIASNTKTFVAAAILRLVEDGRLSLDDTVAERVDPQLVGLLVGDGYDPAAITLEQLLTHTSGIADYASDVDYQTVVLGDPDVAWTRFGQVQWAMDHAAPLGEPGEVYTYSDTGYVLLGDVIERVTGTPLAPAVRDLLQFDRLGLSATWWEDDEAPPAGTAARAHQFYETQDMTTANPTFDLFGGGGLVSTTEDLARFYAALLAGDVFDRGATLDTMRSIPPAATEAGAAMGLFRFSDPVLGECWSHSGFWGTIVVACPDVTIALSVFQAAPDPPLDGASLVRAAARLAHD